MRVRGKCPPVVALVVVILLACSHSPELPAAPVSVAGGTEAQAKRLGEALERFSDAGLELPELTVVFSIDERDCHGRMGWFDPAVTPWRITICSTADFVYEHELAHAWERANLTDERRRAFMVFRGHDSWADPDDRWMERGVEGVAFIIQQGLLADPLTEPLTEEMAHRMEAFELLTGRPAPRISH